MNRLRRLWLALSTRRARRRGRAALAAAAAAIHHKHTCRPAEGISLSLAEREAWLQAILLGWTQEEFDRLMDESAAATPERRPQ